MISLDVDQDKFLNSFKSNLNDFKYDFFILKGQAGSGKSTIINECVQICKKNRLHFEVLAFTGRAASILKSTEINNPKTIHRWISEVKKNKYFMNLDSNLAKDESFTIFIDEASMIPNSGIFNDQSGYELSFLLDELMWVAYKHLPFKNIFIIFIGDPSQLPPIYENFSSALDLNFIKKRYELNGLEFSLKNIYRQKSNSKILKFSKNFKKNKSIEDIPIPNFDNEEVFELEEENVAAEFLKFYESNSNCIKIISPDNKTAEKYNFQIKKFMYDPWAMIDNYSNKYSKGSFVKDKFLLPQVGDILQISKNDYNNELFNGQFVKIKEVNDLEYIVGIRNKLNILSDIEIDEIPFIHQKIRVELVDESGKKTPDKNITISIDFLLNNFYISENEFNFFEDPQNGFISEIKDEIWNSNLDSKLKRISASNEILNPTYCKYGFSITGHKAQGGGWENVIIDFSHFQTSKGDVSPSWIYTSLTRSKSKVFIVNYPSNA